MCSRKKNDLNQHVTNLQLFLYVIHIFISTYILIVKPYFNHEIFKLSFLVLEFTGYVVRYGGDAGFFFMGGLVLMGQGWDI